MIAGTWSTISIQLCFTKAVQSSECGHQTQVEYIFVRRASQATSLLQ